MNLVARARRTLGASQNVWSFDMLFSLQISYATPKLEVR
jgi:hypothetical protein